KVLYSTIDSVDDIVMSSSKFSHEHKLSIPSDLGLNLKECQIFASVMNKKKMEEVFSTRIIVYTSNNSASVVLHWIHKRSKKQKARVFNLQIGWIIVGQPVDFRYENCNFCIINRIEECAPNGDHQISICDKFQRNHSILVSCTQQAPQQSIIHPEKSTLVTGVHFACLNGSQLNACFFMYDLETETLYKENFEGKLIDLFIHCSLFHEKSCQNCGFVNLAPNYLIFNSLGDVRDDLQISYFCAPLSAI
ncbi:1387_t:CDS:2, partial [Cetraspora pellucida]